MSEAVLKRFINQATPDELDLLDQLIAKRREQAEIEAGINRGMADFDAGKFVTADEFVAKTEQYIAQAKAKKCRATT